MAKFSEKELTTYLKDFENVEKIELEFEKSIDGKAILSDASVRYDDKYGYINITSKEGVFKINTTLVCSYELIDEQLLIDLESLMLKIKK